MDMSMFQREQGYRLCLSVLEQLRDKGLLTAEEFVQARAVEQANQMGGNLPDEVGLFLYIGICLLLQLADRHLRNLRMGVLFICPANES